MRIVAVLGCLCLAASVEGWKGNQQKESRNMERKQGVVQFVNSETLPPAVGYSQAAVVTKGRFAARTTRPTRRSDSPC